MVHVYSIEASRICSPAAFFDVQNASISLLGALGYDAETCFDGTIQTDYKLDNLDVGALKMAAINYRGIPIEIKYVKEI